MATDGQRPAMELTGYESLSACEAARAIRTGAIRSEQLVEACLERLRAMDAQVEAWAFLDPEHALAQARAADVWRLGGKPIGALHGIPVGIKDVFDTADMPTEYGSVLHAGRAPSRDAAVVSRLRAAGAILLGKTVTTEFAYLSPGKTKNPHQPEHTPGGSSSGSAAAVAANMVPLAIGSQTNGSTIRPASFCGVLGFKPTHGWIPRTGMLTLSRTLDHVGLFARSIEDLALLATELVGYDEGDPDTIPRASPHWLEVASEEPPTLPQFGFVKTPHWELLDEETRQGFTELIASLGARAEEVELMPSAHDAWRWHQVIMQAEMAANLDREWQRGQARLSPVLRTQLEQGRALGALEYQRARACVQPLYASLLELFEQRYDALITPAAPGPAPKGLASTGDPSFCTLWTLCGMPALSLPLLETESGLPIGVQLVGARDTDARLLRSARWLANFVASGG